MSMVTLAGGSRHLEMIDIPDDEENWVMATRNFTFAENPQGFLHGAIDCQIYQYHSTVYINGRQQRIFYCAEPEPVAQQPPSPASYRSYWDEAAAEDRLTGL